ncbi:MAG: cytochrome c [Armatimonadota bacterium]|nr:cytochrome c [Armatimonadota bacterium]MDR7520063.1 cytochrome c [Armatimonadota bacterium]MDR7551036.1 cytochrome c [Armatimonadota bacterium]
MHRPAVFLPLVCCLLAAPSGLLARASPAPPPPQVASAEQVDRGRTVFRSSCATCHGPEGQGGEGPTLIGPTSVVRGYRTAQTLFDFVSANMPFNAPGSLKAEDYWDVLAFVLDANGLLPPDVVLGPETAPNIRINP